MRFDSRSVGLWAALVGAGLPLLGCLEDVPDAGAYCGHQLGACEGRFDCIGGTCQELAGLRSPVAMCRDDADCSSRVCECVTVEAGVCTVGVCVECSESAHCVGSYAGPLCKRDADSAIRNRCVGCLSRHDCPADQICLPTVNQCRADDE